MGAWPVERPLPWEKKKRRALSRRRALHHRQLRRRPNPKPRREAKKVVEPVEAEAAEAEADDDTEDSEARHADGCELLGSSEWDLILEFFHVFPGSKDRERQKGQLLSCQISDSNLSSGDKYFQSN